MTARARFDEIRSRGERIGLAPTMGALHQGHVSLAAAAARENDVAVITIFVNPRQFAPDEDLDSYPRRLEADLELAAAAGVTIAFVPSVSDMYSAEDETTVTVAGITERWEGVSRPTHFAGVATVVTKLFNIVGPCRAYFGEKDFQQLAMLRRMVADLKQPIEIVGMPTIREETGLAMSSRNLRLRPEHREQAPVVSRALRAGIAAIDAGERDPDVVEAIVRAELATAADAEAPDYVAVVEASTLRSPDRLSGEVRILTAVRFGDVRLIDNMGTIVP